MRRKPPRPVRRAPSGRPIELTIEGLGARGDGVARLDGESVFVAATLPGDRVVARLEGRRGDGLAASLIEVLEPGPGRVAPRCPHWGSCGGCGLQHFDDTACALWKRDILAEALGRAGFDAALVAPAVSIAPGTRRRATFAWRHRRDGPVAGFTARASHLVVDIRDCPLLRPELVALLAPLRALLGEMSAEGEGDAVATLTETGIDLLLAGEARLDLFDLERLAAFAAQADLARLHWRRPGQPAQPVAMRRAPTVRFAGIGVEPPPGAFLQPSPEGEAAIAGLIGAALAGAASGPVADLYAGCGSFTFPLAQGRPVHAVEGDAASMAALLRAAHRHSLAISGEARDLADRPLLDGELKRFAAVVFDPPRAGAAAQAEILARAGPPLVVAVSCNPATLARDARLLAGGGYVLERATPIDQFAWSAHLEAVAVFRR